MLTFLRGNLFESPAQTLVNTVNTQGVMGKGIALGFKRVYPEMFEEYRQLCERGELHIGQLHVWRTSNKIIINFPTKREWRKPSRIEYIEEGLRAFVETYESLGIYSVAFPPLGCGNGELNFDRQVRPVMEEFLRALPIPVYIYAPLPQSALAEHRQPGELRHWLRSEPAVLPFGEVMNDLAEVLTRSREVSSLSGSSILDVELSDDRQELVIHDGKQSRVLHRQQLEEAWRRLRSLGIVSPQMLDVEWSPLVLAVFATLPYVSAIRLADQFSSILDKRAWGVQLTPADRANQTQMSLGA